MAIEQYLSNIRINGGQPGVAFGGYIFSARSEAAFINSPNKCIIRVILPNSPNALPISPSLLDDYVLSINNYSFQAYLLESTVEKTVGETILNLVFCDQSVKLDRATIGLYKRAGPENGRYGNLFILGKEVQVKNYPDGQKFCLGCDEQIIPITDSIPVTLGCEARDVYYTATEVASAIAALGVQIGGDGLVGGNFSYTGSVREVLSSICSDLGKTWYFDWSINSVVTISSGASIPNINLNDSSITSYSKTLSKEGTFISSGNTFSILPGTTASLSAEHYTQIVLNYAGGDVTEDVACGVLAQISKELRDDYCYGRGMYYRLGFGGTMFGGFQNVGNGDMKRIAEMLGDQALWDLAAGHDYWIIATVDPELRNYWEAKEAGALQMYGKKYKASGLPPMHDYKKCAPGEYSTDISYDRYPDFDDAGNWEKQVGIHSPQGSGEGSYKSQYPSVVVPILGQVRQALYNTIPMPQFSLGGGGWSKGFANRSPITDTNAFSFLSRAQSGADNGGLSLVGWRGKPFGNAFGSSGQCIHPDEEGLHPVKQNESGDCNVDPCGGKQEDPCKKHTEGCSNQGVGISQGISSPMGWCYRGVILPSTAPFYGWVRKKRDVSKYIKGSEQINPGNLNEADVKEARYQSIDTSKGDGGSVPSGGIYSLATSLSVEYAGIKELPIVAGLTNFSYIIDSNGAFTSVNYNTRPTEAPKPDPTIGKIVVKKLAF